MEDRLVALATKSLHTWVLLSQLPLLSGTPQGLPAMLESGNFLQFNFYKGPGAALVLLGTNARANVDR